METNIVREFDKKISDETIINIPRKKTYDEIIDELEEENENLASNMPWNTTEQATEIQVTDAAKYSRNKLELFGNTEQTIINLPSGYTQLDYIESTGTQFINLDYLVKQNTKLEIEYQTERIGGNTLFGASNNNMNYYASGLAGSTSQTGQDYPTTIKVSTNLSTEKTSLLWERAQVTYNGNVVKGNFGLDNSRLVLFKNRRWQNDSGKVKLYKFIAYDGNIIAANYIPCKNGDNDVGLYDVVSNTFYGNSGTGDLVAGNEITIPSPDYPQPIHVVTGNNIITVSSSNLFNKNNYDIKSLNASSIQGTSTYGSATNQKHIYIPCKPNTDYVVIKDVSSISFLGVFESPSVPAVGVTYTTLYFSSSSGGRVHVKTGATAQYLDVRINTDPITQYAIDTIADTLFIAEGTDINMSYQPYYYRNFTIDLGDIELCRTQPTETITYRDEIFKNNSNSKYYDSSLIEDAWYKLSRIIKHEFLPGHANPQISGNNYYFRFSPTPRKSLGYMKGYIYDSRGSGFNNMPDFHFGFESGGVMHIKNSNATGAESMKDILLNAEEVLYYVLATPTSTQITDETLISQLDAIYEHLQLVKGTNNITVTAEDLAPNMQLTYMQDLPTKLDKLEAMIIENS